MMTRGLLILVASCMAFTLARPSAVAREWSAGAVSSLSFVGLQARAYDHETDESDIISLTADFYGLVTGRTDDVGVKFSYVHDYVLGELVADSFIMKFHAGAGFMTGYVHDNEAGGPFLNSDKALSREMGVIAALSCTVGLRFDFERPVAIDIGLSANPGIHLRTDRDNGSMYLSFYKNGVFNAIFPHISLMYRF